MAVDDVVQAVARAIDKLPTAELEQVGQALEEAQEALARATEGTLGPEVQHAVATYGSAISDVGQVHQLVTGVRQAMEHYLSNIGGVGIPTSSPSRPEPPAAKGEPSKLSTLAPDRVKELRSELPPPVPKPNPQSAKTHGRWVNAGGNVQKTVSGEDEHATKAWQRLQAAGVPPNRKPVMTTHVEAKVAAQMIDSGQRHTELVVNNRPCIGPLGCDSLLPVLLPKGYSVTVYGPEGYEETFEGGEQW